MHTGGDGATPDASNPADGSIPLDGARADGAVLPACLPTSACDVALPDLGETDAWRHPFETGATVLMGSERHRGRDLYLREGDRQWALAKFAYGGADDDLKDEDVDIYLLRGCGSSWEFLGTATTTEEPSEENPAHETVEGVLDTGGRVYFEIPFEKRLGIGRHRLAFVVRGDHTTTSQFIEVVPAGTRFVVTDVDGTQTESEEAEVWTVAGGPSPAAQPSGPELMWAFANRGYRIFYLTARPEWIHMRTHEWLEERGYPPGNVHTTMSYLPAMGSDALNFKKAELFAHLDRFPDAIDYTVGNTNTDTAAFSEAGMPPERSYLYQYDPGSLGTRVDDYATLIPIVDALPAVCQ